MDVYIYCADIYCEACGEKFRQDLTSQGLAPADPDDEYTYDSDQFPKGPYPDGGGESDSPQHCGNHDACHDPTIIDGKRCGKFLENDLTSAGVLYLKQSAEEDLELYGKVGPVVQFWLDHYRQVGYDIEISEQEIDIGGEA